jgi:hypothetical protein
VTFETEADRVALLAPFDSAVYLGGVIPGLFDNAWKNDLGVASTHPAFTTTVALVPGVGEGSTLTINGVGYTVTGTDPDGYGMVTLDLRKT